MQYMHWFVHFEGNDYTFVQMITLQRKQSFWIYLFSRILFYRVNIQGLYIAQ